LLDFCGHLGVIVLELTTTTERPAMGRQEKRIEREDGTRTSKPVHPGEILSEEFLKPAKISQSELARHIECDVKTINRIVNGHTGISPVMARKLGAALGPNPEFWLNLQQKVDLYEARQETDDLPSRLVKSPDNSRPPAGQ